jgi:hypothetical protein
MHVQAILTPLPLQLALWPAAFLLKDMLIADV